MCVCVCVCVFCWLAVCCCSVVMFFSGQFATNKLLLFYLVVGSYEKEGFGLGFKNRLSGEFLAVHSDCHWDLWVCRSSGLKIVCRFTIIQSTLGTSRFNGAENAAPSCSPTGLRPRSNAFNQPSWGHCTFQGGSSKY